MHKAVSKSAYTQSRVTSTHDNPLVQVPTTRIQQAYDQRRSRPSDSLDRERLLDGMSLPFHLSFADLACRDEQPTDRHAIPFGDGLSPYHHRGGYDEHVIVS